MQKIGEINMIPFDKDQMTDETKEEYLDKTKVLIPLNH